MAIAATYVGAVVGAGFASGQEVLRFFTHYGPRGLLGLPVAAVLFALCGAAILLEGRWTGARTHRGMLEWLGGPRFAVVYDVVITGFLFGVTAVMIAGSGAFFREQLGLPSVVGDLVMAAATLATVMVGFRGVVVASEAVVPFLLASVVYAAAAALLGHHGLDPGAAGGAAGGVGVRAAGDIWRGWWRPDEAAAPSWLLAALLYASYNLVLSPAVLAPLAARAESCRSLVTGGVIGGFALGGAVLCVNVALLATLPESASFEVPMLYVVGRVAGPRAPVLRPVYGLILWAEIYTTAVGVLYGFAVRMAGADEGLSFRRWVLAGGFGALAAARAGFSNIVTTVYPIAGYAGLLFLAVVLWRLWRRGRAESS